MEISQNLSNVSEADTLDPIQKSLQESITSLDFMYSFLSHNKEHIDIPENDLNINVQSTLEHILVVHMLMKSSLSSYFKYLEENGND